MTARSSMKLAPAVVLLALLPVVTRAQVFQAFGVGDLAVSVQTNRATSTGGYEDQVGSFPGSRYGAAARMVNNILYIIGGDAGQPSTPNILTLNEAASLAPGLVSPLAHDFGNVNIYSTSPNQAFILSNSSSTNRQYAQFNQQASHLIGIVM